MQWGCSSGCNGVAAGGSVACGGDGAEEDVGSTRGLHRRLPEVQDGSDLRVLEEGGEVERHRAEDEHDERGGGGGGGGLEQGELPSREGERARRREGEA